MIAGISSFRAAALDSAPPYTRAELEAKTKAELIAIAVERGISGVSSKDTKAVIIDAILSA
jgi:hypothetical protein